MRYLAAAALVLLLSLRPAGAAADESGDFTEWARKQSDACDRNWSSFVAAQPRGPMTAPVRFENSGGTAPSYRAERPSGWHFDHKGFIHKADYPFMPLSTKERGGASRGTAPLESPAKATLGIPNARRRPVMSSSQIKSSLRTRSGVTRLSIKSGNRLSRVSSRRSSTPSLHGRARRRR